MLEQWTKTTLPHKTSVRKAIHGAMTDHVPPTVIVPTQTNNKTSCRASGCAKKGETSKTTKGADYPTDKIYKTQKANSGTENSSCSSDCPVPGITPPPATDLEYAALSPVTGKSDNDHASADGTMSKKVKTMTDKTFHLEGHWTPEQAQFVQKTTQGPFHREPSEAQEAIATGVTLPEPEETVLSTVKTTKHTLHTERNTKTQLGRGVGEDEIFEAQNASRSVRAVAKGEMAALESGHSLLLPQPEQPRLEHARRTSPHQYLSGVTQVSDDLCGSGNYTAEMSLSMGGGVEPGDAVPALGTLRVVINLKTNNSLINLEVTSCCLSPNTQADLSNSTCCLFSRLAAEPAGITLLPSSLSTSASFTISLFQMINYSVVYLHCDLSICPRNHSDCERQCLHHRSAFPLGGPETIVTNLGHRISFGPLLKQVKNSTFPEEIDPSELDLVLVVVSLVVGFSLVTVMLLLVWLAYRGRAVWLLHSAAPPIACCRCLRPGGDLILP
ncbi:uromodulin-like 1 [Mugil cephalus]|uniref:uromodulin-like 1 n=1 Tax=Mugil cephalus TaxID=48193 RepID=UPI001FB624FA|nr:uromodulin-like 1 [Mugil cephalus]